jgi:DNA polymerase-3 subunit delta'
MEKILGQKRAVEILRSAMRSNRMHHAWLFAGPRGVGKHTTAIELARIVLDPLAQPNLAGELHADPDSPTSREISAGTHPDLHLIHKELALESDNRELRNKKQMNIPIDLLRERMLGGHSGTKYHEAAAYRTAIRNHGKVFIIDEAELLDGVTQNALLKTLEEPPAETYIILVTNRVERLLPTVRSRCQLVNFKPLDDQAMQAWMEQASLDLPPTHKRWIMQFAEGSPGRAFLAAEYELYRWHEAMTPLFAELDRRRFPVSMGDTMAELVEQYAAAWVKNHKNASKDAANKDGVRLMLSLLAAHVRQRLAAACERGEDVSEWVIAAELLREAETQLYSNVNIKMLLENLAVQWHARRQAQPA